MHEYSSNPDVVERVREQLAWVTKFHRRYVEIRPEDARELIDRCDKLTAALAEMLGAGDDTTAEEGDAIRSRARAVLSATPTTAWPRLKSHGGKPCDCTHGDTDLRYHEARPEDGYL